MVVATCDASIKIFKGAAIEAVIKVDGIPSSICPFHNGSSSLLAAAVGSTIYLFRDLRPYGKFVAPQIELSKTEQCAWLDIRAGCDIGTAADKLKTARDAGEILSARSLQLIALESPESQAKFARSVGAVPQFDASIVCLESLRKNKSTLVSSLVLGLESGSVHVLDPGATKIILSFELGVAPMAMSTFGELDSTYVVAVACRNMRVHMLGEKGRRPIIQLESQPVGLLWTSEKILWVGTSDSELSAFTCQGKKMSSHRLPSPIHALEMFEVQSNRAVSGIIVALRNGEVRLYHGKVLVNTLAIPDGVRAMRFGRFSREDGTLAVITAAGGIEIKMLPRLAGGFSHPVPLSGPSLTVPERSQLCIDQSQRELLDGSSLYAAFQTESLKLRIRTAQTYRTASEKSSTTREHPSLRLSAGVLGLGPFFYLRVVVRNGGETALTGCSVCCAFDHEVYRMPRSQVSLPLLLPCAASSLTLEVECMDENASSGAINVTISNLIGDVPLAAAAVTMPRSEVLD
jgi:Bardet-Biedl syndrome 1 protein